MNFTQKDFKETSELASILKRIDNIDTEYVNIISDEIFTKQPFFLSVLLGCHMDTAPKELDEIMKIYILIWEYFKDNKRVLTNKLTESDFERIQSENIQMLDYATGESTWKETMEIYSADLQNLKSKALLSAVLLDLTQKRNY